MKDDRWKHLYPCSHVNSEHDTVERLVAWAQFQKYSFL